MIIGIDIGNYATKLSNGLTFPSKVSKVGNLIKNTSLTIDGATFYIGEGTYDTEYRKVKKHSIIPLFLYAITSTGATKAVVGLPMSQYRQDKDELRELLLQRHNVSVNGAQKLSDVAVYPEGVIPDFNGVIIDIGGRTTDACLMHDRKPENPFSMPIGTLNLYSDFIKQINSRHGLDLKPDDADRIIRNGLKINGEPVNVSMDIFREYVDSLVNVLQIEYSIKTHDVLLIGGGCQLLHSALVKRIPAARLISNPVFANAINFQKVGEALWR